MELEELDLAPSPPPAGAATIGVAQTQTPALEELDVGSNLHVVFLALTVEDVRAWAPALLRDHPAAAEAHVARWLGSKAEFLKA